MAAMARPPIQSKDLKGLKYFKLLRPLLDGLHDDACDRDRAGNRRLFYDQYACLVLLAFFNPILKSLRAIQQASTLAKVQRLVGGERVSRGALSEASRVFDPQLLQAIIGPLARQALPVVDGREAEALRGLTAVDGSLLPALPKMAWALWQDPRHRAAKMHVHFDVLKAVPTHVSVTAANAPERDQWQASLQPGGFYVVDRGYRDWELFEEVIDAGASFVARVQENTVIHAAEERPVTEAARAAGVVRDVVVDHTGPTSHRKRLRHPLRLVVIDTGKRRHNGDPELLILCTNRLDLSADLVALAYRYRWAIETTFEELRAYVGLETTRGRLPTTVLRVAPCLFGLYTLVAALYVQLPARRRRHSAIAWPGKQDITFSDALTAVRRWLWVEWVFAIPGHRTAFTKLSRPFQQLLLAGLAPAA